MRLIPWFYDVIMAGAEKGRLREWRRNVLARARGKVLEIGAGTGLNFPHYSRDALVIASDIDAGMLARATKRSSSSAVRIVLVAADAEALPFRERAFDSVVVGLALCTIPDPRSALDEMKRVLGPAGSLHLLEHVRVSHPVAGRMLDWLTPVWKRVAGGCHLNRQTAASVAAAGFHVESVVPHVGGLFVEITASTPASGSADARNRYTQVNSEPARTD